VASGQAARREGPESGTGQVCLKIPLLKLARQL
jgi:hypothetical protein